MLTSLDVLNVMLIKSLDNFDNIIKSKKVDNLQILPSIFSAGIDGFISKDQAVHNFGRTLIALKATWVKV